MAPRVHYARSGEVTIAYQVVGDGPIDMVIGLPAISHLEVVWERARSSPDCSTGWPASPG
jgi:hypothetical protein